MTFLAPLAAAIAVAALAVGGVGHVAAPRGLPDALRIQGLVPGAAIPVLAIVVPAAELAIAATAIVAAYLGATVLLTVALVAATALFAAYAAYLHRVVASGRSAPCGCSMSDDPADGWSVARAVVFAVVSAIAAATTGTVLSGLDGPRTAVVALAATTVTLLVWRLPAAMRQPAGGAPRWTS